MSALALRADRTRVKLTPSTASAADSEKLTLGAFHFWGQGSNLFAVWF